jgi:hypothetical protein
MTVVTPPPFNLSVSQTTASLPCLWTRDAKVVPLAEMIAA